MMAASEERTVQVFRGHREIFESLVNLHRGRIFNTAGDAVLAEFNSPVEAVRCATEIQAALRTRNENLAPEEKMHFAWASTWATSSSRTVICSAMA